MFLCYKLKKNPLFQTEVFAFGDYNSFALIFFFLSPPYLLLYPNKNYLAEIYFQHLPKTSLEEPQNNKGNTEGLMTLTSTII